jgi:hypothetical protein
LFDGITRNRSRYGNRICYNLGSLLETTNMNIITKVKPIRPSFLLAESHLNQMIPKILGVYCAHKKLDQTESNELLKTIFTSIEVLKNGS